LVVMSSTQVKNIQCAKTYDTKPWTANVIASICLPSVHDAAGSDNTAAKHG